ncbi:hypothetical protein KZJ41_10700 [Rhodococcus sp. 11-3]|nr:hypothetical protein KZJ41_10700 [Rhodococcus sp. 11-3]
MQLGRRPLFQFNDDVRDRSGDRMRTGEHDVGTLRSEREMVLDQHLDIAKAGIDQILRENRQASAPRLLLGLTWAAAGVKQHLLQQLLRH